MDELFGEVDTTGVDAIHKNAGLKYQQRWLMDPLLSGETEIG